MRSIALSVPWSLDHFGHDDHRICKLPSISPRTRSRSHMSAGPPRSFWSSPVVQSVVWVRKWIDIEWRLDVANLNLMEMRSRSWCESWSPATAQPSRLEQHVCIGHCMDQCHLWSGKLTKWSGSLAWSKTDTRLAYNFLYSVIHFLEVYEKKFHPLIFTITHLRFACSSKTFHFSKICTRFTPAFPRDQSMSFDFVVSVGIMLSVLFWFARQLCSE
jgi:hypothetical protein